MSDTKQLGDTIRVTSKQKDVAINTPAIIEAASQNGYRAVLPDGRKTFLLQNAITSTLRPLRTLTLDKQAHVYHQPNQSAAVIRNFPTRTNLTVMGEYGEYYLIEHDQTTGWLKR